MNLLDGEEDTTAIKQLVSIALDSIAACAFKVPGCKYSSKANTLSVTSSACVYFDTAWPVPHSFSWLCFADPVSEADPAETSVSRSAGRIVSLQLSFFFGTEFSGAQYFQYLCVLKPP